MPERVLDDSGGVHAYAQFQEQHVSAAHGVTSVEKFAVTFCSTMPAVVFYEGRIGAQVHGHGAAANGAPGQQFRRDGHGAEQAHLF